MKTSNEQKLHDLLKYCPPKLQVVSVLYIAHSIIENNTYLRLPSTLFELYKSCYTYLSGDITNLEKFSAYIETKDGTGLIMDVGGLDYPSKEFGEFNLILSACMFVVSVSSLSEDHVGPCTSTMSMDSFILTVKQSIEECSVLTYDDVFLTLSELNITKKSVIDIWN